MNFYITCQIDSEVAQGGENALSIGRYEILSGSLRGQDPVSHPEGQDTLVQNTHRHAPYPDCLGVVNDLLQRKSLNSPALNDNLSYQNKTAEQFDGSKSEEEIPVEPVLSHILVVSQHSHTEISTR